MNLLTYRSPTNIYCSDTCKHVLSGFLAAGKAWRWKVPDKLLSQAHINLLEFLGSIVYIWLDIVDRDTHPESCLLAMRDSTTAIGWLKKSNFTEVDEDDTNTTAKLLASRWLARLVKYSGSCFYSQWFLGSDNDVDNFLSRDFHLSIPLLTNLLTSHTNSHLPHHFKKNLPSDIDSWLCSVLGKLHVKTAW